MEFSREGISEFTVFIFASLLALATGFGFSGGIYIAANLLQPWLTFIPAAIYATTANILFAVSVITWGALQYKGMKGLIRSYFPKPDAEAESSHLAQEEKEITGLMEALIVNSDNKFGSISKLLAKQLTSDKLQNGPLKIDTENEKIQHALIHRLLGQTIENLSTNSQQLGAQIRAQEESQKAFDNYPWTKFFSVVNRYANYNMKLQRARQRKIEQITTVLNEKLLTLREEVDIKRPECLTILQNSGKLAAESFNQILPQTMPSTLSEFYKGITPFLMDKMTKLNALFINSIGLALYGGFSLIEMLAVQSIVPSIIILSAFAFVGFAGAMSFSRPAALNAVNVLFGYSKEASEGMKLAPEDQENHGYFSASSRVQRFLALFMSSGIAVGNYIANTAFGEVFAKILATGDASHIFTINDLMTMLISSPFAAGAYSIAFGIMAGICTFFIVSSLLLNGTLNVTPKGNKPLRVLPSAYEYFKTLLYSATFVLAVTASAAIMVSGYGFATILMAHTLPMAMTTLTIFGCYTNYRHCQENGNSFLSNLFISTTVLVAALTSAYLNSLAGTVYFMIFGPTLTPFVGLLIGIANLELGLAMFRGASANLNAISDLIASAPKPILSKLVAAYEYAPSVPGKIMQGASDLLQVAGKSIRA